MIGKQIKKARQLAGLSQKELGDAVGKGISTISEWESGKRSPDIELIPKLGRVLNVSQAFLMVTVIKSPWILTLQQIKAEIHLMPHSA